MQVTEHLNFKMKTNTWQWQLSITPSWKHLPNVASSMDEGSKNGGLCAFQTRTVSNRILTFQKAQLFAWVTIPGTLNQHVSFHCMIGAKMPVAQSLAIALLNVMLVSGYSYAAGQANSGKDVAVQLCASCHLVAEDQQSALADVPTFASIAAKHGEEIDYLAGFLADPHPPMPNFNLTRREIRDLLAYIKSLR